MAYMWWTAVCRSCGVRLTLEYAGEFETGKVLAIPDYPSALEGVCPRCAHAETYGGQDLGMAPGPSPYKK